MTSSSMEVKIRRSNDGLLRTNRRLKAATEVLPSQSVTPAAPTPKATKLPTAKPTTTPTPTPKPKVTASTTKPEPEPAPYVVKVEERRTKTVRDGQKVLVRTVAGACVRSVRTSPTGEPLYRTWPTTGYYVQHHERRYDTVARYSDGHSEVISSRWQDETGGGQVLSEELDRGGDPCIP